MVPIIVAKQFPYQLRMHTCRELRRLWLRL